jgi:hypothetical protein
MWAGNTPSNLCEQRSLDLNKLGWLNHVQNLFNLVQEHDLLGTVDLGPEPQQAMDNLEGEKKCAQAGLAKSYSDQWSFLDIP